METPFQNRLHHTWCLIGSREGAGSPRKHQTPTPLPSHGLLLMHTPKVGPLQGMEPPALLGSRPSTHPQGSGASNPGRLLGGGKEGWAQPPSPRACRAGGFQWSDFPESL